jgi:aminoglycoside 3-N-acetyltransferase I
VPPERHRRGEAGGLIRTLAPGDATLMQAMLDMFGTAFDDAETYAAARPTDAYLDAWLAERNVIALAALHDQAVIGGLVAYELRKFEQARSEIYIYDLAVAQAHRRQGIATALIGQLRTIARARGAWVIYVQADLTDPPAIALYTKLGTREDVLHFDISP